MFIYFSTLCTLCIYMLLLPSKCIIHYFSPCILFTNLKPPFAHLWKNESESHLVGPALWDPMDYTVHGILQARLLEWVAFPFWETCPTQGKIAGGVFSSWATREVLAQLCFLSIRTLSQFSGLISTCMILPCCLFFKNFRGKIRPLSSYVHTCIPSLSSPYPFLPDSFLPFPPSSTPFSSSPPPVPYPFFFYFLFFLCLSDSVSLLPGNFWKHFKIK